MPRKPNYKFERHERERLKAEKKAKRAAEKKGARDETSAPPESSPSDDSGNRTE